MGNEIEFNPSYSIPVKKHYNINKIPDDLLESLIFHIGMVELVSYWKSACPPKVIIKPFHLTSKQIKFWKKLYFNGLGEFFYLNGIDPSFTGFMTIESEGKSLKSHKYVTENDKVIVPIGGGKDSVVTVELLKNSGFKVYPMAVNPREAVERTIEIAGYSMEDSIIVKRTLDKKLLELNEQGFLNGHTPFSALLAFITALTAILSGIKHIALSNESSANESTVPGSKINHQYSKSFEFEQDFRNYFTEFISPDVNYFSFLRPLNELQIGYLFSKFKQHHYSFRSCNVGSKEDKWCGKCPKCLFTRIILGPFIDRQSMFDIFNKELLNDKDLEQYFNELTGNAEIKPFECVGTPGEVNIALSKIKKVWKGQLPLLLKNFDDSKVTENDFENLMKGFNNENALPDDFISILKKELNDIHIPNM